MKLTIEPTPDFVTINGQPLRVWRGQDEAATPVHVYVRAVAPQTHDAERLEAFEKQLQDLGYARPDPAAIDIRMVL